MANTFTASTDIDKSTVFGNARVVAGVLTMTDGAGGVNIGLDRVFGGAATPLTAATGGVNFKFNTSSGNVHVYSCASADTFNIYAFGR